MSAVPNYGSELYDCERLFNALAEEIKLPLVQISRQAELGVSKSSALDIETSADSALRLIDGYLLSVSLQQKLLELEPVSVSAVLYDSASQLQQLAKQYDCRLELHFSGRYGPVMAHKKSLEAAILTLGQSFIEASSHDGRASVMLAAHRSNNGIVAGVYSDNNELSAAALVRYKKLYGRSKQPFPTATAQGGASVFIADSLMAAMDSKLHMSSHQKFRGLAGTFLPSKQLQLV